MSKRGTSTEVRLCEPGRDGKKIAMVDPGIAPFVQALNDAGIKTVASCCGHGLQPGNIVLGDGRELYIIPVTEFAWRVEIARLGVAMDKNYKKHIKTIVKELIANREKGTVSLDVRIDIETKDLVAMRQGELGKLLGLEFEAVYSYVLDILKRTKGILFKKRED